MQKNNLKIALNGLPGHMKTPERHIQYLKIKVPASDPFKHRLKNKIGFEE